MPANYETGLAELESCDLIIEAIAEKMDWKQDLYRKIAPHVPAHAVLASNTSGLGINALADVLPEELRHRFCGVHFFNPPRYMRLIEIVTGPDTDTAVARRVSDFVDRKLGKRIVPARDTPGFIANRLQEALWREALHMVAEGEATGLALGAWGAVQATCAGLGIAIGGVWREIEGSLADLPSIVPKTLPARAPPRNSSPPPRVIRPWWTS